MSKYKKNQKLTLEIDNESVNIFRDNGDDYYTAHVVYWNEEEWIEDPETVVPAILNAIWLYYTNQVELLKTLGLHSLLLVKKVKVKVVPIKECGDSRRMTLCMPYKDIVKIVGEPNVTDMDDPNKVKASWGFKDKKSKRTGFIWAYKYDDYDVTKCDCFSADGNSEFMKELFGENLQ